MRRLRAWFIRFANLFRSARHEQELADEIESNIQLPIDENIRLGMTAGEARRDALLKFGSLDASKEAWRERCRLRALETFLWDLKYAVRQIGRNRIATAVSVLSLTLCIGANTAIFSIADAVMFKPMPYSQPGRVHIIEMANRRTGERFTMVPQQYLQVVNDYHRGVGEVGLLAQQAPVIHVAENGAERIPVVAVTPNYFGILGVEAVRGRLMNAGDRTQVGRPVMLTHAAWLRRFNASDEVVGRPVTLGTATFDVVGVLPPGLILPSMFARDAEIVTLLSPPAGGGNGGAIHPIVRLEPGVTREQAQAEMDALVAPFVQSNSTAGGAAPVLDDIRAALFPFGRPVMAFLLAGSALVLLIGCANLANIFLARAKRRERETGLRAALGAGRTRLIRPVVFEALLIGMCAALLAIPLTVLTFDILLPNVPPAAYANAPVGVDYRVAVFALSLALVGGLVFAAAPAWRTAHVDPAPVIHGHKGAPARQYFGRPMIAVQVGLSVVLVFGAVIAARAFVSVNAFPLGITPDNVVAVRAIPPGSMTLSKQDFYIQAIQTLAARGDVISAGAIGSLPLDGMPDQGARPAGSTEAPAPIIVHALPGYWETARIPLLRGRLLDWNDVRTGLDVAVLSESAAHTLFPGRDPLGAVLDNGTERKFTVAGIVSDSPHVPRRAPSSAKSLDQRYQAPAYVIPRQQTRSMVVVARMRGRQDRMLAEIRQEIGRLAPGTLVTAVWWSDSLNNLTTYRNPRFQTLVLGAFSSLALLLTAIGIFGVLTFQVVNRTREMGIRMALGAPPSAMVRSIIRQTMIPVSIGILGGLVATRWLSRLAEAQLYDVDTSDPLTLIAAVLTVAPAAYVAAYVPARRASRIDPLVALRHE